MHCKLDLPVTRNNDGVNININRMSISKGRKDMKIIRFVPLVVFVVVIVGVLLAQTKINGQSQVSNLSAVVSIQRALCVGSGTTGSTTWNCAGLQMYRMTLDDGTVLGPFIAIPATAQEAALSYWQTLALGGARKKR